MSSALPFLLLLLSFLACTGARHLKVQDAVKEKLHHGEFQRGESGGFHDKVPVGATMEKLKASEAPHMEGRTSLIAGVARIQSLVTVSWRIPRGSQGDHPGFNSDYSPPKTHPPSHN